MVVATAGSNVLLLAWDVSAVQEEPWRRLVQELPYARGEEGYLKSRRRLGVSAESVWLVAKPTGGGVAVVCLEVSDPERALVELAESQAPFDSWYGGAMRKIFGVDLARVAPAGSGELLFTWRDGGPGEREAPKSPFPDAPAR
jgi:hypothetical protein